MDNLKKINAIILIIISLVALILIGSFALNLPSSEAAPNPPLRNFSIIFVPFIFPILFYLVTLFKIAKKEKYYENSNSIPIISLVTSVILIIIIGFSQLFVSSLIKSGECSYGCQIATFFVQVIAFASIIIFLILHFILAIVQLRKYQKQEIKETLKNTPNKEKDLKLNSKNFLTHKIILFYLFLFPIISFMIGIIFRNKASTMEVLIPSMILFFILIFLLMSLFKNSKEVLNPNKLNKISTFLTIISDIIFTIIFLDLIKGAINYSNLDRYFAISIDNLALALVAIIVIQAISLMFQYAGHTKGIDANSNKR